MKPTFFAAILAALSFVSWTQQPSAGKVDLVIHAGRFLDGVTADTT